MQNGESLLERLERLAKNKEEQLLLDPSPSEGKYFSRLRCQFTSSESHIHSQYLKLFKKYSEAFDPTLPLSENIVLRRAVRLVSAYKVLMIPKLKKEYLNQLKIRVFASQPFSLDSSTHKGLCYPFMLFPIAIKDKDKEKTTRKNSKLLEISFLHEMIYLRNRDTVIKYYPFASIARVLAGFQEDEIIIDFNAQKPAKLSLQYPQQRNFFMEVLKLACISGREHSKKDKVNDPHNINFTNSPTDLPCASLALVDIIKDDKVLPPKLIRQDAVYKKSETLGEQMRYLSLGVKQMLISKDKEVTKIVSVIPIEYGKILVDHDLENKSLSIKNSFRTFDLRFCDGSVMSDWLADYKKVADGTNEALLKHSNELLSYLIQDGKEELKMRRLRVLDAESEKLKAKLSRLARERSVIAKSLEDSGRNLTKFSTITFVNMDPNKGQNELPPRPRAATLTKSVVYPGTVPTIVTHANTNDSQAN